MKDLYHEILRIATLILDTMGEDMDAEVDQAGGSSGGGGGRKKRVGPGSGKDKDKDDDARLVGHGPQKVPSRAEVKRILDEDKDFDEANIDLDWDDPRW